MGHKLKVLYYSFLALIALGILSSSIIAYEFIERAALYIVIALIITCTSLYNVVRLIRMNALVK
ncbi:hypothetical protein [Halalkalibacterium halodurans]|jgi:hypothetical protein|uniref:hypothetical protein n=1 Tax=Halalkalibacterium halodurans TaxID=86665 RepID=UPI00059FDBC2|nr:hypothetical protein [Halalkalibacterium halodurans]MED3645800.1 hypothetical protein [Halalkalibacterium halodurans]MED4079645.1 hypothetical protein [Halalkalibacterium halodurans]MED4108284.1 hypothetical protein [Halalkalibacterium halodurans]MED4147305.1 hypothetical protein [Halalkalibacterium halodurans]MED4185164.1 hypothetical protein [Halalkalibacterium halodurans]